MKFSHSSDVGLVRNSNEDSYCAQSVGSGVHLMAVADGMGGYAAGEVASFLAIQSVVDFVSEALSQGGHPGDYRFLLEQAFQRANEAIRQASRQSSGRDGMGTTLTVALLVADRVYLGHAGDSRAYLIRDGAARTLTSDHSLVGEMVRNGEMTEAEAMSHPQRNILTNALGTVQTWIELIEEEWQAGDALLLCTDGLTNLMSGDEISAVVSGEKTFDDVAPALVAEALRRGGHDNVTVVAALRQQEVVA